MKFCNIREFSDGFIMQATIDPNKESDSAFLMTLGLAKI
jgi:hypothetical protein